MELTPADRAGYLSAKAIFRNDQLLSERLNNINVEDSQLLRKPLNVQTGKEDGHQGGRRFNPTDRGYQILAAGCRMSLSSNRIASDNVGSIAAL